MYCAYLYSHELPHGVTLSTCRNVGRIGACIYTLKQSAQCPVEFRLLRYSSASHILYNVYLYVNKRVTNEQEAAVPLRAFSR